MKGTVVIRDSECIAKCRSLEQIDTKKGKKWRKKPGRNVELFQKEKVQILYKEVSEDRLTSNI